jgi:hypothetical protein
VPRSGARLIAAASSVLALLIRTATSWRADSLMVPTKRAFSPDRVPSSWRHRRPPEQERGSGPRGFSRGCSSGTPRPGAPGPVNAPWAGQDAQASGPRVEVAPVAARWRKERSRFVSTMPSRKRPSMSNWFPRRLPRQRRENSPGSIEDASYARGSTDCLKTPVLAQCCTEQVLRTSA